MLTRWPETPAGTIWHHLVDLDPDELYRARERQKMQLARYAKQSLLQWDDVEVSRIRELVEVLREVLEAESAERKMTED